MAAPKAPLLERPARSRRTSTLEEAVFAAEVKPHLVHEAVRAELNAHRAGTFATKSRGLVSGGRAKPWRQKGTGRARQGTIRAPQFTGGGARVRARCRARFDPEGEPQGRQAALRARARRATRRRARSRSSTPTRSTTPSTKQAQALARGVGASRRRSSSSAPTRTRRSRKSFRNLPSASLVVAPSELEVARGRLGALAARHRGGARRSSQGRAASDARRARSSSRRSSPRRATPASTRRQVHVQGAPGRAQDADPPGRRGALRRQGRARQRDQGAGEAEAPRRCSRARGPAGRRPSCSCAPARRSRSSRERSSNAGPSGSSRPARAAAS